MGAERLAWNTGLSLLKVRFDAIVSSYLGQKNHKTIKGFSRSADTIQKDWTIAKSYELREAFCIAVVGHEGWNNEPDAYARYSLVVSFEAVNADIPVYSSMVEAQIPTEVTA